MLCAREIEEERRARGLQVREGGNYVCIRKKGLNATMGQGGR